MKWSEIERARRILTKEHGTIVKDWGGKLTVALIYPNTYEVGMSSLGFQTIYRLFNDHPHVVCERAFWQPRFAPDEPVIAIESQHSIADLDVLAFSVAFELDYLHLIQILRQAGIPLDAAERDADWPLIVAGGPAVSANPLPLADFVDAFVIGEAEELIVPLVETIQQGIDKPRADLWRALALLPGVYVPHLDANTPVQRQWVRELENHPTATVIHTPDTAFGPMHLIEVARGCGRGCRFCMAGFTSRPKREHSVASVLQQAQTGLAYADRIGLVGAAVSDYAPIDELVIRLREMGAKISVSSLRVDPLSEPLLQALVESGAQTLTLAPEAGSERLRALINKGVTEADLLYAAGRAAHHRFRQLKLYFMIGLPGETDEDIDAIAWLCEQTAQKFTGHITANVTPFVPKAHTPFQWTSMTPTDQLDERLARLQRALKKKKIDLRSESPRMATIQGLLARGDRRLGQVLKTVRGTSTRDWEKAMQRCEVEPEDYMTWNEDKPLPWSFIDTGVKTAYLRREWMRALKTSPTEPCPPLPCERCGVCTKK
ncbi:MAG: radical SAM protein [Anaerolineae bacterium]|nr:radical SAM protein [Anaerolineae bacterium]